VSVVCRIMSSPDDADSSEAPRGAGSSLRSWRYLFVLIGLVLLVLGFYAEENWRGYHDWQKYQQQMAARGELTEPEALIPPRVPDAENFATTPALAPLFDFFPGTQRWRDPNAPQLFSSLGAKYDAAANWLKTSPHRNNSWVGSPTDLDAWAWAFSLGTNRNAHEREPVAASFNSQDAAGAVLRGLAGFDPVLDELRQASHRRYARFNIRYEEDNPATILLPHLAKLKYLSQVLRLRASAELALGRTDESLADLNLLFYLIDTTRAEPILISQLVRMAQLQIALQPLAEGMGKWSESQLLELQQKLERFDFLADMERSLQAERILFGRGVIEYVRRSPHKFRLMDMFEGNGNNADSAPLWSVGPLMAVAPTGWLYLEERNYTRLCGDQLLPVIDLTNRLIRPGNAREAQAAIFKQTNGSPVSKFVHHRLFAALLLPALGKTGEKAAFAQTAVDLATVGCALERYRLAHGRFPNSLEELTPKLMRSLPHDIINGKGLGYRLNPDGHYVLYSVGWNEKDDDGVIQLSKSGSVDQNEGDWVWSDNL